MATFSSVSDRSSPSNDSDPLPESGLSSRRDAWRWVPTLYFAEGIPFAIVMLVTVIMYQRLGISNTKIAFYTSWLYLPWVIKPFWSPLVDMLKSKRWWILAMQLLIGAGLAGVALTIPTSNFLQYTLAFLWLLAFSSATHDIAADGFYMLALSPNNQAWFVGIRSTFYRIAMITAQGLLVMLAGFLESSTGLPDATIDVRAIAPSEVQQTFEPDAFESSDASGPTRPVFRKTTLDISRSLRSKEDVATVVQAVKRWNVDHGFYADEEERTTGVGKPKAKWLVALEDWIRRHFGPRTIVAQADGRVGNVGIAYIMLAGAVATDDEFAVQVARTSGDKNIRIIEGERFTVTDANRGVPMALVIQLDAKLDKDVRAVVTAWSGNSPFAWATTFYLAAGMFIALFAYHFFALPRPSADATDSGTADFVQEFFLTFASFFKKRHVFVSLCFLLLYRFAEAQLAKVAPLFLLDTQVKGGLALTTAQVGVVYGTVGVVMLLLGGITGGFLAARNGLKAWIWWMVLAINLPNAVYVFLSFFRPDSLFVINCAVGIEQFGYGFGFAAYMLYMLYFAKGEHETAHFAICTGFMALGVMIPGMWSGWLQELIGYQHFFVWILIATLPSFVVVWLIPVDPEFGKK